MKKSSAVSSIENWGKVHTLQYYILKCQMFSNFKCFGKHYSLLKSSLEVISLSNLSNKRELQQEMWLDLIIIINNLLLLLSVLFNRMLFAYNRLLQVEVAAVNPQSQLVVIESTFNLTFFRDQLHSSFSTMELTSA